MSESVSTGGATSATSAPAQTSAPSTSQATTSNTPAPRATGGNGGQAQTSGVQTPGHKGAEATTQVQERILSEQDLDAFIVQKIDGQDQKIKIRDALKGYGLEKSANRKLQEAAQAQRQQQQLNHLFKTDFAKWCEVTGTDKKEFLKSNLSKQKEIAEEVLAHEYELMQMDPHQRRALELEQQVNQMKSQDLERKKPLINQIKEIVPANQLPEGLENATEQQLAGFLNHKKQEFQTGLDNLSNELLAAWEKNGLPKEKYFGSWMAQVMREHNKNTGEYLQPEQAAAKVKASFLRSTKSLISQMDAVAIQELLGEDVVKKLRDHDVKLASQSGPLFNDTNNRPVNKTASEPKKSMNQLEWRKAMGIG